MPITVPTNVQLAPGYILKIIRCSCASESPRISLGVDALKLNYHVHCSVLVVDPRNVIMIKHTLKY